MNQPGEVHAREGLKELPGGGLDRRPRLPIRNTGEGGPGDALHDDEVVRALDALVQQANHTGQPGPPKRSDLPPGRSEILRGEGEQQLECDLLLGALDACEPDRTEATPAQGLLQNVSTRQLRSRAEHEFRCGKRSLSDRALIHRCTGIGAKGGFTFRKGKRL